VITIIKMLLEADVDVGAVNESGYTALDTALHLGCAEFIEGFSRDGDLLTRATNHLDDDRDGRLNLDEARRRIRAQMILMQQRSALDTPRKDKTLLDEVVNNPIRYLNLVSYEDLVTIFNEGSEAKRLIPVYHKLINEAIESENLKVLERIPVLVKHYGFFLLSKKWFREPSLLEYIFLILLLLPHSRWCASVRKRAWLQSEYSLRVSSSTQMHTQQSLAA
jgi:hypothetical protein